MIRVSVDNEDELKIVRDCLVKASICGNISEDQCDSIGDCEQCVHMFADRFIQVTLRKVIEEEQPIVL